MNGRILEFKTLKIFQILFMSLLLSFYVNAQEENLKKVMRFTSLETSPIASFSQELIEIYDSNGEFTNKWVGMAPLSLSARFNKSGQTTFSRVYGGQSRPQFERFYNPECESEQEFYRYLPTGELSQFILTEYNQYCQVVKQSYFSGNGNFFLEHPFQIDKEGNIKNHQRYQFTDPSHIDTYDNRTIQKTQDATTSAEKRVGLDEKEAELIVLYYPSGQIRSSIEYLNKYGDLLEAQRYYENGEIERVKRCEYEFDHYNNWIKKSCTLSTNIDGLLQLQYPQLETIRNIVYY